MESPNYVSYKAQTSREIDSRKNSHSTKFEHSSQIFVKLSFRDLCDSKLSGVYRFDKMDIIH